ncbi:MAG: hypothetical protein K6U89_19650 [Chloroflexi bacterium]|nr:hypothetical protein [Chloroflexota bacterium]
MRTLTITATINDDGHLRLDVPTDLPPGPVEIVLAIDANARGARRDVRELRGLGREIWQRIDAQTYVNGIRDEWDR